MPTGKRSVGAGQAGKAPPQPSAPPGRGAKKGTKGPIKTQSGGWPQAAWLGFFIGLALFMVYRRTGGDGAATEKAAKQASGGKKASGEISTMRFLELAMRLQEMTDIASQLEATGMLDGESAGKLDEELKGIEAELGDEGTIARDLKSMVSVVRGTLMQRGNKLTDEEVEATGSAYTYANPRYWDDYYNKTTSDEKFDWYGSWDTPIAKTTFDPKGAGELLSAATIGDVLRPYVAPEHRILMFGCGNSDMSEKMYADGFENIVNIDISATLLDGLRERLGASMPKMSWQYENASALTFEDAKFDVTIDKGTLDAIEQNKPLLYAAAKEAHRTLRPGGYFLSVTFNGAMLRVDNQLREGADWGECHTHEFERPDKKRDSDRSVYFVHACQKQSL